ncbi:response regulator [Nodosilinea sp. E11]|uniref:response regulator n=1 Tax=Nodosilinea sp. E11 TaxID=3037479 RepID=UPI002934D8FC|nr:response regulator [Nodosilinea sp. E11]WOD37567.1 response regulator [Nodosilinea sp. E11]
MANRFALKPTSPVSQSSSVVRIHSAIASASAPARQLLLIDDEPDICCLVKDALGEFEGWQVTTCQNPSHLDAVNSPLWDAILLEVSVTRLGGFALVPALRANPLTRQSPIVLLTSQVMPRDYARFQQMAIAGVIPKPFDPVTLGRQIAVLLGWPEARGGC